MARPYGGSVAQRCALVCAICGLSFSAYWIYCEVMLLRPELAPYYDPDWLRYWQIGNGVAIGVWVLLFALALRLRRRAPQSSALAHATVQLYSITMAIGAYAHGTSTSAFPVVLIGGGALGFALFERRLVLLAIASGLVLLLASEIAVTLHLLPHAPLLRAAPYVGSIPAAAWRILMGALVLGVGAAVLALVAATVGRLREREAELEAMAQTDALTGAANRRHFLDVFERELARAVRRGTALSCVVLDLDHFKAVNDRHGHLAGDRVLVAAADVLRQSLRTSDVLGRWGGEEFVLLLPETDEAGGRAMAERARRMLAEQSIAIGEQTTTVTASFGLACAASAKGVTPDALIRRADEALYRAKAAGRNRLEVAG